MTRSEMRNLRWFTPVPINLLCAGPRFAAIRYSPRRQVNSYSTAHRRIHLRGQSLKAGGCGSRGPGVFSQYQKAGFAKQGDPDLLPRVMHALFFNLESAN